MDLNHCYYFRLSEEDDGTVLFCAEFRKPEDFGRVVLEDCEVDKAYINELREIAEENSVIEYFKSYRKRRIKVFALDAPSYSCTIIMSDGSHKSIDSRCDGSAQLRSFFAKLGEKYGSTDLSESAYYW